MSDCFNVLYFPTNGFPAFQSLMSPSALGISKQITKKSLEDHQFNFYVNSKKHKEPEYWPTLMNGYINHLRQPSDKPMPVIKEHKELYTSDSFSTVSDQQITTKRKYVRTNKHSKKAKAKRARNINNSKLLVLANESAEVKNSDSPLPCECNSNMTKGSKDCSVISLESCDKLSISFILN